MKKVNLIILAILILCFFLVGSVVDYWQATQDHSKYLYPFVRDYFGLFWLILYSGLLPFLMVWTVSKFSYQILKLYVGVLLFGSVIWDISFSLLYFGKIVSGVDGYFYWGGKNFGLTTSQLYLWHGLRILLGSLILLSLRKSVSGKR